MESSSSVHPATSCQNNEINHIMCNINLSAIHLDNYAIKHKIGSKQKI